MRFIIEKKSGCWLWQGAKTKDGYAEASWRGRPELVSRLMFTIMTSAIPKGRHICHHCDNPVCVNPEHLFIGTPSDNISDASKKGRLNKKSWANLRTSPVNRKLTFEQAEIIRKRFAGGELAPALGREYGVSHETIYSIVHNRSYRFH